MQVSELSIKGLKATPLESVPIAEETFQIISRLVGLKPQIFERCIIYGKPFVKKMNAILSYIPQIMQMHAITFKQRCDCLNLLQLSRIDLDIEAVFDLTRGNLDLMLILFRAIKFQRSPNSQLLKFLQQLTDYPFKFADMDKFLAKNSLSHLETWLLDYELPILCNDIDLESQYSAIFGDDETSEYSKHSALVDLIWTSQVKDKDSLAKALRLSFLSFNIINQMQNNASEIPYKTAKLFALTHSSKLWQILPKAKTVDDFLMLLLIIQDRLSHDLQYNVDEFGAGDQDHILFQILEQVCSVQVVSSSELKYDCITGPIIPELILNKQIQTYILDVCPLLQILLGHLNISILKKQVKQYLAIEPLVFDGKLVLKQSQSLTQRLSYQMRDALNLTTNYLEHQEWVERLIETWVGYLKTDVYYLLGTELTLIEASEKYDIFSYLIVRLFQYSEVVDFGARVIEGTVLTSLETILSPQTLQSLLIPILVMLTSVMQNQMSLARSLLEPQQNGFVTTLITHLKDWRPAHQSGVYKLPQSFQVSKLLSFFECLSLTELGQQCLKEKVWQVVLQEVLNQDIVDSQLSFLSNTKLDTLAKSALIHVINESLTDKITKAQSIADLLLTKYDQYYEKYKNYKLAGFELRQKHKAEVVRLKSYLQVFAMEPDRQKIKFDTWLDLLSHGGAHYDVFSENSSKLDATRLLTQREDLFTLMETLSYMKFDEQSADIMQLVQQVIESEASRDRNEGILVASSVIVKKLQAAIEQPVSRRSFTNFKCYFDIRFLKKSRVVQIYDFSDQIKLVMQQSCQIMSECQSKISDYCEGQEDGLQMYIKLQDRQRQSLQHYKREPELLSVMNIEQQQQVYLAFLNMLFETADPQQSRQLHFKSFQEIVSKNQYAIGESLAILSQSLKEDVSVTNEFGLSMIQKYMLDKQFSNIKIGFIVNGGVANLCKLWKVFIKNEPLKSSIVAESVQRQTRLLADIFKSLISSARSVDKSMALQKSQTKFTSVQELLTYLFHQLFSILEELDVITKPGLKPLNFVVYMLLLALLDKPWGAKDVQEQEYVPSQDEITQLTFMGFEQNIAETALVMSRQTGRQALEILLSDQDGLYAFQSQQQVLKLSKEQNELERALLMSIECNTQDQFYQLVDRLQQGLTSKLLQVNNNSVISTNMALLLINHDKQASIPELPQLLLTKPDTLLFKISLVMLQKGVQWSDFGSLIQVGDRLLSEKDQQSLYFYNLFMMKLSQQYEVPELQAQQKSMLLCPDVLSTTKDIILASLYLNLLSKPRLEQSAVVLELLQTHITWTTQSELLPALFVMAFYSKESHSRLLSDHVSKSFATLKQLKHKQLIKLQATGDLQIVFQLKDLCSDLFGMGADQDDVQQVLTQTCIIKDTQCYWNEIAPQQVAMQQNEQLTVELMLNYFESGPNEVVANKMPFKYYVLGLLTKMVRIHPHLQSLLTNFGNLFVTSICQVTATDQLYSTIVDVLTPLAGCKVINDIIDCSVGVLQQHPYAVLSILSCLVTDVNIYETNRTICPSSYFQENISYLLKTPFVELSQTLELEENQRGLLIQILREMSQTEQIDISVQQAQVEQIQHFWGHEDDDDEAPIYAQDIINHRPQSNQRQEIGLQGHLNAFLQHLERRQSQREERFSEEWTQEESQAAQVINSLMLDKNKTIKSEQSTRQLDSKYAQTLQESIKNRDSIDCQRESQKYQCLKPLSKERIRDELNLNVLNFMKQTEGDDVHQEQIELKREAPVQQPYQLVVIEPPSVQLQRANDLYDSVVQWVAERKKVSDVNVNVEPQVSESIQETKLDANEEVKNEEIQVLEEEKQERSAFELEEEASNDNPVQQEQMTYGFPNSVLLEFGIEPEILHDLPEDLRSELLSTVNWQQPQVQQPADEGLDQEFLNSLPPDLRAEIVEQHRRDQEQQQPRAQPAELDIASFIETILDPQMRIETLLGLPPEVVETLPINIRAEFAQAQNQYNDRQARAHMEELRRENRGMVHNQVPSLQNKLASLQTLEEINALLLTPDEAAFANRESISTREPFSFDTEWYLQYLFSAEPNENFRFDLIGLLLRQPQKEIIDKLFIQLQKPQNLVQNLVVIGVLRLFLKQRHYSLFEQFLEQDQSVLEFTINQLTVTTGALLRNYQLLFCEIMQKVQVVDIVVPESKIKLLLTLAAANADKAYQLVSELIVKMSCAHKESILSICGGQIESDYKSVFASIKSIDYAIPPTQASLASLQLHPPTILTRLTQLLQKCGFDYKIDNSQLIEVLEPLMQYVDQVKKIPLSIVQQLSNLVSAAFENYVTELKVIQSQKDVTEIKMQLEKPQVQSVLKSAVDVSDGLQQLCKFCVIHKELINRLLEQSEGSLAGYLNYMPGVLTFQRKQKAFNKAVMEMNKEQKWPIGLKISRKNIFMDAFAQLGHKSVAELQAPLKIEFTGEVGIDAGGLRRDFYIELSKAMFDPNYSLFNRTSNGVTFHPNQQSHVNPEHLNFFRFIGRFIGKSLHDGELLELHLSKPIYKMMVGEDLVFEDLEDLDNVFHQSVQWSMKEDVSELGFTFSVTRDYFGKMERQDLIPDGNKVQVTNENKMQYLEKLSRYQMYDSVKQQIDAFLKGFHELIPKSIVQMFSASELDLLISGLPKVDLLDLKRNTNYVIYNEDSPQIKWLWQALEGFTDELMGKFLQFVTGCSRVPLAGFAELQGMQGPEKFRVAKAQGSTRLPQGHTCYNQLDLPEYESFQVLQQRLIFAISECGGFGFA